MRRQVYYPAVVSHDNKRLGRHPGFARSFVYGSVYLAVPVALTRFILS